jgi:hypothetical protein
MWHQTPVAERTTTAQRDFGGRNVMAVIVDEPDREVGQNGAT